MSFDLDRIRAHFPALALRHDAAAQRVYLDNPAGTQVPHEVLDRDAVAAHGRAATPTCTATSAPRVRPPSSPTRRTSRMADMYHAASPDEIVFGPNMTTLTFMMARVLGPLFQPRATRSSPPTWSTTATTRRGASWPTSAAWW